MSYLAPRQKATLPGIPILGKPSTSYPRRFSLLWEWTAFLSSLWNYWVVFLPSLAAFFFFVRLLNEMLCPRCLNRWNQFSLASNLLVSSFQPRSILFFIFVVSQILLPFRHRKLRLSSQRVFLAILSFLAKHLSPTSCFSQRRRLHCSFVWLGQFLMKWIVLLCSPWLPGICSLVWRRFFQGKNVANAKQQVKFICWTVLCSTSACFLHVGSQHVHFADGAEMMTFLLTILLST